MGACCVNDRGKEKEEVKEDKGKGGEITSITLHVQSKMTPHYLLKVYQIVAKLCKFALEVKETQDLSTIKTTIRRYPLAECDRSVIVGEKVIPRFMAQKSKIYPENPEEAYLHDSLIDQICDMWNAIIHPPFLSSGSSSMPTPPHVLQSALLPAIENRLPVGKDFFVGNKMTPADVFVFCFLDEYYLGATFKVQRGSIVPARLVAFHAAFQNSPEYKAFLDSSR